MAGAAGGFILVRYLVNHMAIAQYGVVELLDTMVIVTMLSDVGIRGALGRHLVEHISQGNDRRMNELLTLSALCYALIGVALFLACWLGAPFAVRYFNVSPDQQEPATLIIRLFIPTYTLLTFLATSYGAVIESHHRFDIVDLTHVLEIVLRLALIFVAIGVLDWGLEGWAFGYAASKVLALLVYAFFGHRLSPGISYRPQYLNFAASHELFSLGGLVFVYNTVFKLTAQTDPFILSRAIGTTAVGLYKPAYRVATAASPFVAVLNRQLRPLATSYYVKGRIDLVRELLVRGTKISMILSMPFTIIFLCFALPLVQLWLEKPEFRVTGYLLMLWSLADFAANAAGAQWQVMLGLNRVRFMVLVQSVGAALNLVASIVIVATLVRWGWSLQTCVLSIVAPTIVTAWAQRVIITVHVARETEIGLWTYFRHGFLPAILVGVGLGAVGAATVFFARPDSWLSLLSCIAITVVAWLPLSWLIGFDHADRARVWRVVNRFRGRLAGKPVAAGSISSVFAAAEPRLDAVDSTLADV